MGAAYIVRKRARFVSINGPVNLRYGTPVDAVDGFLVHNGRPLCAVTSESAHRYFARNDDGNGKARGALIGAITAKLERKDAGHQMRWDCLLYTSDAAMDYMKLVADLCQIIDRQNEITKAMVAQLGQRDALRYEEEMAAVRRDYDTAMGEVDPCKN